MEKIKNRLGILNIALLSTHMFCCVLPLVSSLVSVGVISLNLPVLEEFMHHNEVEILTLAGIILFITGVLQYISYKIDCRVDGACTHEPCSKKKKRSYIIFGIAVVLFTINLSAFLLEHSH